MAYARAVGWLVVLATAVLAVAALAPVPAAAQWCGGAYDSKLGTNFGVCPPAPTTSLYQRLGRREGIALVVDDFIANMVADPRVNARFKGLKPPQVFKLKSHLSDQICDAGGGPCAYLGRTMKDTHKGMGITEAEWSATVENLVKALDKHRVDAYSKNELLGRLGPLKRDIVGQ